MNRVLIRKFILSLLIATFTATSAIYAQEPSGVRLTAKAASVRRQSNTERFIRAELFFGRDKPDGTEVSEEEFAAFLTDVIAPEFPDGLTVLSGLGQFRAAGGDIIQEKTKLLILLYPTKTGRQSGRKIERIREAYKERFRQQSVLRVDGILPVKVSF